MTNTPAFQRFARTFFAACTALVRGARPADPMAAAFADLARDLAPARD